MELIDREKVMSTIRNMVELPNEVRAQVLGAISRAKTVDAKPVVHGRWVMKETMVRSPFAKNAYCSLCLEETSYAHNYCPNCGADMRGAEDG